MRWLSLVLLLTACLAGLGMASQAGAATLLSAVSTNVSSAPIPINTATQGVAVHIRSASTSAAVVTIETSLDNSSWVTAATINNPSSSGEIWLGPGVGFLRVTVASYTSGAITVTALPVGNTGAF